jgi:ABC-type sugar transport system substrate-binding protein
MVLLVTGTPETSSASMRRAGFLDRVRPPAYEVHELDGRWNVSAAEEALGLWFKVGAARRKPLDAVVCQNDAMARGARSALLRQAESSGRRELERLALVGCDGLAEEGRSMVARGELAATVVMPPTTPAALEILRRYWDTDARPATVLLEASSHPALETLGSPP